MLAKSSLHLAKPSRIRTEHVSTVEIRGRRVPPVKPVMLSPEVSLTPTGWQPPQAPGVSHQKEVMTPSSIQPHTAHSCAFGLQGEFPPFRVLPLSQDGIRVLGAPGIPGVGRGHEVRRVALPGEGCQHPGHQHSVGTRTMEMNREAQKKEFSAINSAKTLLWLLLITAAIGSYWISHRKVEPLLVHF